jgi:hypothetical protein
MFRVNVTPLLSVEFHGHGGTTHNFVGLSGFWHAVFSESLGINGSSGTAHDCPCHTEINGNLKDFEWNYRKTRYSFKYKKLRKIDEFNLKIDFSVKLI